VFENSTDLETHRDGGRHRCVRALLVRADSATAGIEGRARAAGPRRSDLQGTLFLTYTAGMKIAIVGPGKLGSGLGKLWARRGHQISVTFSRDRARLDAGQLENARYIEAYAILVIRLGHTLGLGTNIAMRLMRR